MHENSPGQCGFDARYAIALGAEDRGHLRWWLLLDVMGWGVSVEDMCGHSSIISHSAGLGFLAALLTRRDHARIKKKKSHYRDSLGAQTVPVVAEEIFISSACLQLVSAVAYIQPVTMTSPTTRIFFILNTYTF
jgi:hypothetical protein